MRAVNVLGILLEKLLTTNNQLEGINKYLKNNQLEGINKYLKNNQLNRFQRNHHFLRANILCVALICEVISNILILQTLIMNLEHEKADIKHNKLAKKLLDTNKIIGYEIEDITGKIYVEIKFESILGLIYIVSQNIHYNLYADKFEMLEVSKNDDKISDKNDNNKYNENTEHTNNESDNNNNSSFISSKEVFNYIEQIFRINTLAEILLSKTLLFTLIQSISNIIDINSLNTSTIYQQEFKEFLESTLRTAKNIVDVIYKEINPYKHRTSSVNIISLDQEKKQY
ncbi:15330_t:CDS:2 [Cetraspora pellucida]|uniref:15330_t:CDS:1 n=1 Tax=Cetraspora pellucida TaxID=1433469 RepID=A0A9N9NZV9_9GLOM|nr:15330_t:CDS:2 [Cetraspora pellucida]